MELGKETSQIAYYDRKAQEPVSVATRVGTNLYTFPTALAHRKNTDEWHFGIDAVYFADRGEATLVPDFFETVTGKRSITLDGREWSSKELLAVFFQLSFKLLGLPAYARETRAVCVTCERLTGNIAVNIREALIEAGFAAEKISVEDNEESFYYYCYSQQPSIWTHDIALLRFSGNYVRFQALTEMRNTKPSLVSLHPRGTLTLPEENGEKDRAFAAFLRKCIGRETFSSVFITGEGFGRAWAKESVTVLCGQGRRVFEGNNLFVKGAVYAALEKKERRAIKNRVYLCPYLLQKGICVDVLRGEIKEVYPLIHPGHSWFEEAASIEAIPTETKEVIFTLVSMDGKKHTSFAMSLDGLPKRPDRATRIRIDVRCTSAAEAVICITDLGFGEMYPASDLVWRKTVYLGPGKESDSDGGN